MREVNIILPRHHEVQAKDVNLKRLGAALTLAHETDIPIWNHYCFGRE